MTVTNLSRLAQVSPIFCFFFFVLVFLLHPWNSSVLGKPGRLVSPSDWHNLVEKPPHSFQRSHGASFSCASHMQSLCKVPWPCRDSSVSALPQLARTHARTHARTLSPGGPGHLPRMSLGGAVWRSLDPEGSGGMEAPQPVT